MSALSSWVAVVRTYKRMIRRLVFVLALAAALGPATGPAHAQRCEAPPGTAAVDQYCEMIPEERGSTPSARYAESGTPGGGPETPLGERLASQGFDGVALATFVERTRPEGAVLGETAEQRASLEAAPDGPIAAVRSSVAAGPVTGTAFLLALLAIAALVAGLWALDRRRPRDDG